MAFQIYLLFISRVNVTEDRLRRGGRYTSWLQISSTAREVLLQEPQIPVPTEHWRENSILRDTGRMKGVILDIHSSSSSSVPDCLVCNLKLSVDVLLCISSTSSSYVTERCISPEVATRRRPHGLNWSTLFHLIETSGRSGQPCLFSYPHSNGYQCATFCLVLRGSHLSPWLGSCAAFVVGIKCLIACDHRYMMWCNQINSLT